MLEAPEAPMPCHTPRIEFQCTVTTTQPCFTFLAKLQCCCILQPTSRAFISQRTPYKPDMTMPHTSAIANTLCRAIQVTNTPPSPAQETWPATWRHSSLGKAGLALLGLAFLIATCIQLQGVLTKQWHKDYKCGLRLVCIRML
jgi:hypothetical protein